MGYKVYLPDGTIVFPETMVSNQVWSGLPTSCLVNEDSVALFWREGASAWYTVRDSSGTELVPTSLFVPDSYVIRPLVHASSDSLGRIHASFEISCGVCYAVFEPGVGEVFRDTIPGSIHETSNICVEGNKVHVFFQSGYALPCYIQYDLEGNIVIPPIELVQDLDYLSPTSSVAVDGDGNFWCFLSYSRVGVTGYVLSLVKVDCETGDVLVTKEIETPNLGAWFYNILPGPGGDTLYLMWLAFWQSDHYIYFAVTDNDGNFIEEPYVAYDYSDEELQQPEQLKTAINDEGDVYAIWSQGDQEIGARWLVMGWFDHNWLSNEETTAVSVNAEPFTLVVSSNPFTESVTVTASGSEKPPELVVYDLTGREVRRLPGIGNGSFLWDGCDSEGNGLPVGAYSIRGTTGSSTATVQVVKL